MDKILTEDELAEHLQLPKKTLAHWRSKGSGPKFFRAGRHVRYRESAVAEWQAAKESEAAGVSAIS